MICEAGYNTITELLFLGKPALAIPGIRRIDNQELRAVRYESAGCGYALFPEEDPEETIKKIKSLIDNPEKLKELSASCKKVFKEIMNAEEITKEMIQNEK